MIKHIAAIAIVFAVLLSVSESVKAQDPTCGYGAGVGWGFGTSYFPAYRGANQNRIPYFALNPPVYYGEKVSRPYGISPFATPPAMMPAEMMIMPKAEFKEIANPFFKGNKAEQPKAQSTSSRKPQDKTT